MTALIAVLAGFGVAALVIGLDAGVRWARNRPVQVWRVSMTEQDGVHEGIYVGLEDVQVSDNVLRDG